MPNNQYEYIKASEVGTFNFCQLAWWYERMGTIKHNSEELKEGKEQHIAHARMVNQAYSFRKAAIIIFIFSFSLILYSIVS